MADFVAVIRKAVDNLPENTPENRAKVYEKARSAIRRQLEAIKPKPSDEVIARQLGKLDAAIDEVESEHAEALPPEEEEADRLMAELEALVEAGPRDEAAGPAPASAGSGAGSAMAAAPSGPAPDIAVPPPPRPPAAPAGTGVGKPPFVSGAEHDDIFGLNETRAGPKPPLPKRAAPARKAMSKGLLAVIAAVVVVAVLAYLGWSQREALMAMVGLGGDKTTEAPATPGPVAKTPETTAPGAAGNGTGRDTETALAPAGQDDTGAAPDGKFTQRLNPDGSETDPGPAPASSDTGPVEGRSVAELTDSAAADTAPPAGTAGNAETDGSTDTAEEAAGTDTAEETGPAEPIGVSQKMFLYEERLGQQTPEVTEGSVVWSLAEDEGGSPSDVAIRGEISTGNGGFSALVTIKRNDDRSLPASHIIELVFALPENFGGGSIEQVQRISMKQTEQDQGDPLIAVPAQITRDFYMIALNDLKEAVEQNTRLLRERNWIDIPVVYSNGRRALITLEKGASGVEVFNQALDRWAAG